MILNSPEFEEVPRQPNCPESPSPLPREQRKRQAQSGTIVRQAEIISILDTKSEIPVPRERQTQCENPVEPQEQPQERPAPPDRPPNPAPDVQEARSIQRADIPPPPRVHIKIPVIQQPMAAEPCTPDNPPPPYPPPEQPTAPTKNIISDRLDKDSDTLTSGDESENLANKEQRPQPVTEEGEGQRNKRCKEETRPWTCQEIDKDQQENFN